MGPLAPLRPIVFHPFRSALALLALTLTVLAPQASAQTPDFDFGDGRHGSFTVPTGETTIQDLWSQVRLASDATAYDPSSNDQVPTLENLTISAGGTLTVSAFAGNPVATVDPAEGGVLRLKVRGTLTIEAGAAIDATGCGYRGGTLEGDEPGRIGQQGDTWGNVGGISSEANRGGGGGGFGEISGGNNPGAGGGGGHREAGNRGTTGSGADTSGASGAPFDTVATTLGQGFRDTYPFPRFGSGGGRGGQVANFVNINAAGGSGGGVIVIEATRIINDGSILADGADGGSDLSGGGGGAGGSIWIQSLSTENGTVAVAGGSAGVGTVLGNDGGDGGSGILLWDARFAVSTAVDGQGVVTLSPEGGLYDAATELTVTATPAAGWAFDRWEGDLTGSTSPDAVIMDADKSVTAFFVELPALAVSPVNYDVGSSASTVNFDVSVSGNTSDVNWTAVVASGGDFVSVSAGASGTNDGTITVAIAESTLLDGRTATLTVSSGSVGSDPVTLTINQSAAVPLLEVTPASNVASADGEELVVQVRNTGTGSFDWTASVLVGDSFATITSGGTGTNNGTFVLTFAENLSVLQRTATISVSAPGASNSPVEAEIVQQAGVPLLQVTPSSQLLGSAAGSASLSVSNGGSGTLNWTAAVVTGGAFASVSAGSSGINAGLITVAFSENTGTDDRVATIRVESGDASNSPVEVTITQTAQEAVLQVTPDTQSVGSAANTVSFQVQNTGTGSMNWTASVVDGANFISIIAGTAGTNSGVISVSLEENTGTTERTATIQVQAPGAANNPQLVTIVQTPRTPVLRVVPAEQSIGSAGGTANITIENGGAGALNWTASVNTGADFLTFASATNGSGDSTLQITVAANDTEESRTGTIRIEAPGADGSPQIATIIQLGCEILTMPENLAASDGIFPDAVELIWSATPGATLYEVFRSPVESPDQIELLGTTAEPRFSDTLAEAPEFELLNRGCFNPGEFIITNIIYFYYVKAVNACGTSELSLGTTGHRGLPESELKAGRFKETVLPNTKAGDGSYLLSQEDSVAVRLSSDDGVDVGSLWADLSGTLVSTDALQWVPVAEDNTDGWLVITALDSIASDTGFTVTVGGQTAAGQDIGSVRADFHRSAGDAAKAVTEVQALPHIPAEGDSGLFLEGLGAVHQVTPLSVFPEAQLIWIPVPEAADAADLTLYYYGDDASGGVWYPGSNVVGWLANPELAISEDGAYLGAWVNHGGTVRLGARPATETASASFVPGNLGMLSVIILTSLILLGAGRRRRAA